jgi:hypothetical protein
LTRRPPKSLRENLAWRKKLLELAASSKAAKEDIWIACSRDFEFFFDALAWTHSPKQHFSAPSRPMILWPFQVEAARRFDAAIGRHDQLWEKSRQMGASWLITGMLAWRWLFRRGQSFLIASRKEELVDASGSDVTLFFKIDYILKNLPAWMQPSFNRVLKTLENEENGSKINGESTNDNLGRGGTRTAILIDEFAAFENGHKVLAALRDATKCRVFVSTPQGCAGAFYDQRMKFKAENPDWIVRLHWTQHPEYSKGLYYVSGKPHSPWYDAECLRCAHPVEIAQELDIGYEESGYQFFEQAVLERIAKQYARDPVEGELEHGPDLIGTFRKLGKGNFKLWCPLDSDGKPPRGNYGVGCDISTGKGGEYSSQSVASVVDRDTGRKVAQYNTSKVNERDFGRLAVAICKFFHDARLLYESNGPGGAFGQAILETTGYRNLEPEHDDTIVRGVKMKYGWHSTKERKWMLMSAYREALTNGKFINPCREAIMECGQYVVTGVQKVEHARCSASKDPTASGELHGDLVIGDALANKLLAPDRPPANNSTVTTPVSCLQARMDRTRKAEKEKAMW